MIEAIELTVRRRGRILLDAVSFDVRPGQVTGVLGGTGAGKTTLLRRMVELERGGGETLFDGRPYRSLRHPMREVGLLLDPGVGHPERSVRSHLRLVLATDRRAAREGNAVGARRSPNSATRRIERAAPGAVDDLIGGIWHGLPARDLAVHGNGAGRWRRLADWLPVSRGGSAAERIDAVLDIVGLSDQAQTRLSDLTGGMATRLGIAVALLGDPQALLFDAPERGLEPEGVAWLGALLRAFTGQGRAALVTGSDTETLVGLADRILLLDSGYLVGTRTAEEVLRAPTGAAVVVRSPQIVRFAAILAEAGARSAQGEGACLEVRGLDRARVGDLAYRHGIPVHELSERFTGSDPGDVVLAACSGRNRPVVPFQGLPETVSGGSGLSGILADVVVTSPPGSAPRSVTESTVESWIAGTGDGLSAMQPAEAPSSGAQSATNTGATNTGATETGAMETGAMKTEWSSGPWSPRAESQADVESYGGGGSRAAAESSSAEEAASTEAASTGAVSTEAAPTRPSEVGR